MGFGQAKLKVETGVGTSQEGGPRRWNCTQCSGDWTHKPVCWEWSLWERWEERQGKTEEPAWEGHELECLGDRL